MLLSKEIEIARKEREKIRLHIVEAKCDLLRAELKVLRLEKQKSERDLRVNFILKEGELEKAEQELKAIKSELKSVQTQLQQAQGVNVEMAREMERVKMELWSVQEENKALQVETTEKTKDEKDEEAEGKEIPV